MDSGLLGDDLVLGPTFFEDLYDRLFRGAVGRSYEVLDPSFSLCGKVFWFRLLNSVSAGPGRLNGYGVGSSLSMLDSEIRQGEKPAVFADSLLNEIGNGFGFEVDFGPGFEGERSQGVAAASWFGELWTSAVVFGPGVDAGEVDVLAVISSVEYRDEADDFGFAAEFFVDLAKQTTFEVGVLWLDVASG